MFFEFCSRVWSSGSHYAVRENKFSIHGHRQNKDSHLRIDFAESPNSVAISFTCHLCSRISEACPLKVDSVLSYHFQFVRNRSKIYETNENTEVLT